MSQVRAKFVINSIELFSEPADSGKVKLSAVNSSSGKENESWSKWTPSGTLEMYITNPAAFAVFKDAMPAKKAVYLDFTIEE